MFLHLTRREHTYSVQVAAKYCLLSTVTFMHIMGSMLSGRQIVLHTVFSGLCLIGLTLYSISRMSEGSGMDVTQPMSLYVRAVFPTFVGLVLVMVKERQMGVRLRHLYVDHQRRVAHARVEASAKANAAAHSHTACPFVYFDSDEYLGGCDAFFSHSCAPPRDGQ